MTVAIKSYTAPGCKVPTICVTDEPIIAGLPISREDGETSTPDTKTTETDWIDVNVSPASKAGEKSNDNATCSLVYIGEKSRIALGIAPLPFY
jgi:hypothetical protein